MSSHAAKRRKRTNTRRREADLRANLMPGDLEAGVEWVPKKEPRIPPLESGKGGA